VGYRIHYRVGGRTMVARVSGRSPTRAAAIGREIRKEAQRACVEQLVIDVRGLVDRLGSLGALALAACREHRVAVVDGDENELYHPFSEYLARRRKSQLRYFTDPRAALAWLDD